jgi:hypothetical protein
MCGHDSSSRIKRLGASLVAVVLLFACVANADEHASPDELELEPQSPLWSCPAVRVVDATPARWEWAYWAASGLLRRDDGTRPAAGLGAELTTGVLDYPGFPSGDYGPRLGRGEMRAGVWVSGTTQARGGLLEGGLKVHLGALYHASFGTFDWRMGAGTGAFADGRQPFGNVTLAYGIRSVPSRYHRRGYCDPRATPRALAMASVLRVFVTMRREFASGHAEWELGLELSPTFFLPPYNLARLLGGEPARD